VEWCSEEHYRLKTFPTKGEFIASFCLIILGKIIIKEKCIKMEKKMEIKCQLDATEVFIADLIACSTCFGHHHVHHQELKSIIQWLLPVVFRAVKM